MTTEKSSLGPITGSCLCARVQLNIKTLAREVMYCHCKQCRKQSGHFFAATSAMDKHLQISGEDQLRWYAASESAKRAFCQNCGSVLMWKQNGSDSTSILAGCLDNAEHLAAVSHIFVADKGDYYDIHDGLPQYQQVNNQT